MVGLRRFPVFPRLLAFALFLPVLLGARPLEAADRDDAALVADLRGGGHVIYFRHAATDWEQNDRVAEAGDWKSCNGATMRQLSDAGRETAAAIGRAMRALNIPVGEVISSEYCRCVDTARLLGLGEVRATTEIMNLRSQDFVGGRDAAVVNARKHFTRPLPPGTNRVIVGHGNLMQAATGQYTGEAGAGVFRPRAGSDLGFVLVALVTPEDWLRLAEAFGGGK